MGFILFTITQWDWKEIAAVCAVMAFVIGYLTKAHVYIRKWWLDRPAAQIVKIKHKIAELEGTVMSKRDIQEAIQGVLDAIDDGRRDLGGKMDAMREELSEVSDEMAWVGGDIERLNGHRMAFKTDKTGALIECNYNFLHEFDRPMDELKGMNFVNLLPQNERGAFMKRLREAVSDRRIMDETVKMNGKTYHFTAHPVSNNGKGLLGYNVTVTNIK